ncbi:flagellar protein [Natroniella sulfidigena]|uniref:flagellar protein n=1 Tax=Natroniella sulfidigena TaxID=723921 RepID=UPI00200B8D14|nr:flagellar protein [Natroniella sulfidigena]MCK8816036.1 flagellar protein [Natroniella sulfidigena]
MGIQKCKDCKQIFAPVRKEKRCPDCRRKEEEKFKLVRDYLWDNPGATIEQVHQDTDVEKELIREFVKQGRFDQIGELELSIDCDRCGAPISSGRFCKSCRDALKDGFSKAKSKPKKKKKEKKKGSAMFTRNRRGKK